MGVVGYVSSEVRLNLRADAVSEYSSRKFIEYTFRGLFAVSKMCLLNCSETCREKILIYRQGTSLAISGGHEVFCIFSQ